MFPYDTPHTIADIAAEVSNNLFDAKQTWFTPSDVNNAIQDQYNALIAVLQPIEHSTFIPQQSGPYYNIGAQVADYMYVTGIFNPSTNLWLECMGYKQMKLDYQTYLALGQPKWMNIIDMRRLLIWPFLNPAAGVLYMTYKASAPTITPAHIPALPHSVGAQILEFLATADLMKQCREFTKSATWTARAMAPQGPDRLSLFDQAKLEIKAIARADKENVLEPYRWLFHGGQYNAVNWINNETPGGIINGTQQIFTLAFTPNPTSSVMLMKNGVVLTQGIDFTLNGQTMALSVAPQPIAPDNEVADTLRVCYQI
ncbi:MAG: hypothetical protein WCC64_13195 [Aliidongia sp.]